MRLIAKSTLADSKKAEPAVPETESKGSSSPAPSKINKPKAKIPKPAWALTEEVAESVQDDKEAEDEDDLISFAKNLDYDKYIDDLEVQTMMERVKARIAQLEHETALEDQREQEAEERAVMRMAVDAKVSVCVVCTIYLGILCVYFLCFILCSGLFCRHMCVCYVSYTYIYMMCISVWPQSDDKGVAGENGGGGLSESDEARAAAKELLSEVAELKGVHSNKSVAAV